MPKEVTDPKILEWYKGAQPSADTRAPEKPKPPGREVTDPKIIKEMGGTPPPEKSFVEKYTPGFIKGVGQSLAETANLALQPIGPVSEPSGPISKALSGGGEPGSKAKGDVADLVPKDWKEQLAKFAHEESTLPGQNVGYGAGEVAQILGLGPLTGGTPQLLKGGLSLVKGGAKIGKTAAAVALYEAIKDHIPAGAHHPWIIIHAIRNLFH